MEIKRFEIYQSQTFIVSLQDIAKKWPLARFQKAYLSNEFAWRHRDQNAFTVNLSTVHEKWVQIRPLEELISRPHETNHFIIAPNPGSPRFCFVRCFGLGRFWKTASVTLQRCTIDLDSSIHRKQVNDADARETGPNLMNLYDSFDEISYKISLLTVAPPFTNASISSTL